MGPVETIVDTAWADIKVRFGDACEAANLEPPKVYAIGVSDWFSRLKYPAVFMTLDYVNQETSAMSGEWLNVALDLVLVHTGSKPDRLQTQMMGYTDAMLKLIREDHTFGGACTIGEFVTSDLFAASQQDMDMAIAMISIRLRKEVHI